MIEVSIGIDVVCRGFILFRLEWGLVGSGDGLNWVLKDGKDWDNFG